jgi:hypothetical protein
VVDRGREGARVARMRETTSERVPYTLYTMYPGWPWRNFVNQGLLVPATRDASVMRHAQREVLITMAQLPSLVAQDWVSEWVNAESTQTMGHLSLSHSCIEKADLRRRSGGGLRSH